MNNIIDYEVVMFQGENDGISVFHSESLEECEKFVNVSDEHESIFLSCINNNIEALKREFWIVANFDDGSYDFID